MTAERLRQAAAKVRVTANAYPRRQSVQRAMGHASPATTAVYVGASDTDLDLIAEAVCR